MYPKLVKPTESWDVSTFPRPSLCPVGRLKPLVYWAQTQTHQEGLGMGLKVYFLRCSPQLCLSTLSPSSSQGGHWGGGGERIGHDYTCIHSLAHTCTYTHTPRHSKIPLHDKSRNLVLYLSSFRVLDWCLSKHCEHISYPTIADPRTRSVTDVT